MDSDPSKYWFKAKTYGWGWGLPETWQGWVVLIGFLVLQFAGPFILDPRKHPLGYLIFCLSITAVLIAICFAKGEPPKWRWGK